MSYQAGPLPHNWCLRVLTASVTCLGSTKMDPMPEKISQAVKTFISRIIIEDIASTTPLFVGEGGVLREGDPNSVQLVDFGHGEFAEIVLSREFKRFPDPETSWVYVHRLVNVTCSSEKLVSVIVKPCMITKGPLASGPRLTVDVTLTPRAAHDEEWMRELVNSLLEGPLPGRPVFSASDPRNIEYARRTMFVIAFTSWLSAEFPREWYTTHVYVPREPEGVGKQFEYWMQLQLRLHDDSPTRAVVVDTQDVPMHEWLERGQFKHGFTFYVRNTGAP